MNIVELAQECQLIGMRPHLDGIYQDALEKFAKLVAAHEREACAKVADGWPDYDVQGLAEAIRARGTT
jgi:hypothetical protein